MSERNDAQDARRPEAGDRRVAGTPTPPGRSPAAFGGAPPGASSGTDPASSAGRTREDPVIAPDAGTGREGRHAAPTGTPGGTVVPGDTVPPETGAPGVPEDRAVNDGAREDGALNDGAREDRALKDDALKDDALKDRAPRDPVRGAERHVPGNAAQGTPGDAARDADECLISQADAGRFDGRWREIKGEFVDDPQAAVEQAGELCDEVVRALTAALEEHRRRLRDHESAGKPDTEFLRTTLRDYGRLLQRIVKV